MYNYKPVSEASKNKLTRIIQSSETLRELSHAFVQGEHTTELLYRIILESYELGEKSRK